MHLTIDRSLLLDLLHQVIHVVSTRATLPILSNILIEATADTFTLIGTDLDTYATVHAAPSSALEIHATGSITVPARRLASIFKEMPDGQPLTLQVDTDTQSLRIESGTSQFRILGITIDEFPPTPAIKSTVEVAIPLEILSNGIRKTLFAASRDETRYILNGILIHIDNHGDICFVCTDGRRLAMVTSTLPDKISSGRGMSLIIPTRTAGEIQRMVTHASGNSKATATFQLPADGSTENFSLRVEDARIYSKTIAGKYPDYGQVIPGPPAVTVTLSREAFMAAAQRVALMSPKDTGSIKLTFNDDAITLAANSPDVGESTETIAILNLDRHSDSSSSRFPFTVAYNHDFIMSALHQLQEDVIAFELEGDHCPAALKTPANPDFLYILMPMRVS